MVNANFSLDTADFASLDDFFNYGVVQAKHYPMYFGHGTDNIYDELRWLLTATIGLPYDVADEAWQKPLTAPQKARLTQHLQRRIQDAIPVPYLINEAYFCGLKFYIDERALIPRSPIAELIENDFCPWLPAKESYKMLDLCTGSACIALALAHYFPTAIVDAVDISAKALQVAQINCKAMGLQERVTIIESDCWEQVPNKRYDLIVSNPPYVGDDEMQALPQEYHHEPDLALRAEDNGLALVDTILHQAQHFLSEDGILVVEVGNSDEALQAAYPKIPFLWLEFSYGGHGVFLLTAQQLRQYFGMENA